MPDWGTKRTSAPPENPAALPNASSNSAVIDVRDATGLAVGRRRRKA